MKQKQITFFLAGLVAGVISVSFRSFESPEITIIGLTWGVGPLFFVAVVAGMVITGAWRYLRPSFQRYLAGLVLCTITYVVALIAFFAVDGFSPDWFGFRASDNIINFGIDVWLGLIAAGAVAASGIALFVALLTGNWSSSLFLRLLITGLLTVVLTFIVNLPFQTDWSFLGVLFSLGNGLFCWLAGTHILRHPEVGRQVEAAAL